jgi:hypothetical protein
MDAEGTETLTEIAKGILATTFTLLFPTKTQSEYIFEQFVGEYIKGSLMLLTSFDCLVSKLVTSDTSPRPTIESYTAGLALMVFQY